MSTKSRSRSKNIEALVAAGGLAAALSTAAGPLLVISSVLSHNFMKNIISPGMEGKAELL